ncbi:MAG: DUF3050 domain-containing protein [Planctomycetales bacterium]
MTRQDPRFDSILAAIQPLRESLLHHPLYADIREPHALRIFMQHHVFAVWDFMSLLKNLQNALTCVTVPWFPPVDPTLARFVNEIVLGEESDDDGHGGYASHFDLYHRAMVRFHAETTRIDRFIDALRHGQTVPAALDAAHVPADVRGFVEQTFSLLESGNLCAIASAFTFGREDLLPDVFQKIVDELDRQTGGTLDDFQFYLRRHIELDGGEHGPMAARLITSLCGDDPARWEQAADAAHAALQSRLNLWNGIHAAIRHATLA